MPGEFELKILGPECGGVNGKVRKYNEGVYQRGMRRVWHKRNRSEPRSEEVDVALVEKLRAFKNTEMKYGVV